MSSSSKGGGSASQSWNYYGTLVGAVCLGPVDRLMAVIVDGKAIFEPSGGLEATGDYTDLTSSIEAQYVTRGGYLRIYWGTETQVADPALTDHPPYRGVCYVVAKNFLFGREKSTAPNIEVVVQRRPRAPSELVHADHTQLVDGQASPVAVAAELLTDPRLAGWPVAGCDATSWLAISAAVHASAEARATSFGSPHLTSQTALGQAIRDILQAADLWVRDREGVVEIGLSDRGGDVSGLPLLTAADYTEPPKVATQSWKDVPGRVVVKYHDGVRWKDTSEAWDNPVARLIAETGKDLSLSAPWCTRRDQAQRLAAAYIRRLGVPGLTATLHCRRGKVADLWPGDRVRCDLDPEPSDEVGLAVAGLIVDREEGDGDEVTLVVEADRQSAPAPYVGEVEVLEPQVDEVDPIEHALAVPLPPDGWGTPVAVAVLATRPSTSVVGMTVALVGDSDTVVELGRQVGFAARVELADDLGIGDTSLLLDLVDADGPDNSLVTLDDPADEIEGRADRLLLVLASLDDGEVEIDSDGLPVLEILSLYARTADEGADWAYSCLRGRFGLPPRDWTAATAQAWLLPAENIVPWRHEDIESALLADAGVTLRLRSYSATVEDESPTPPEVSVTLPPAYSRAPRIEWTNPTGTGTTDGAGDITLEATITDREGDLVAVRLDSTLADGTSPAVHLDLGLPPTGSRSISVPVTFAGDASDILTYIARIEARDRAGNVSVSTRTISRPQTGGSPSNYPPPTILPPGGGFVSTQNVRIIAGSGADDIEYVVGLLGSAQPSSGRLAGGTIHQLSLFSAKRRWARSVGTLNPSAWTFADFTHRLRLR